MPVYWTLKDGPDAESPIALVALKPIGAYEVGDVFYASEDEARVLRKRSVAYDRPRSSWARLLER